MRALLLATAALAVTAAPVARGEGPSEQGLATAVRLEVGERLAICKARLVAVCPVSRFICDDPKVATVELVGKEGAELVGVGAGFTRCAVYGHEGGSSRLLEITVTAPR
jgi:Flp pilus assembly secretin CpaC